MDDVAIDKAKGTPRPSSGRGGGCIRRLAIVLTASAALGFCAGSIFLVLALQSETGQAAIVSWALVEEHDGIVISLSDRLIEESPDDWQHYRRKALSLRRLSRHDESFAVYQAAADAIPDLWWPHSHLCFYGALYGDPDIALEHCDKAIALEPSERDVALYRRSIARALVGDLDSAAADMQASMDALDAESSGRRRNTERAEERAEWLAALEEGRNPFDDRTLAELRVRFSGPPERQTEDG